MKIDIYFLNSKLTTEINKNFQVKELIDDLKEYLNTKDSDFILFDNKYNKLKETDTIIINKEKELTFYLIKSTENKTNLKNFKEKEILTDKKNLLEIIQKCTGAKNILNIKKNMPERGIGLLDILENRNNNPNPNINPLDRILNLLQVLEENNQIRIGVQRNNGPPVEADEQSLRELQEMGFPEDRARQALINSRNDINRATEILLGEEGE